MHLAGVYGLTSERRRRPGIEARRIVVLPEPAMLAENLTNQTSIFSAS